MPSTTNCVSRVAPMTLLLLLLLLYEIDDTYTMEILVGSIPAGDFFPRISIVYTTLICLRDGGNSLI